MNLPVFLFLWMFVGVAEAGELTFPSLPQPAWGHIARTTNSTGTILLEVGSWPADGKLSLPTPFPNITAVHLLEGSKREPMKWVFNTDATRLQIEVPLRAPLALPALVELETAENSEQFADGRVVFSALDARVQGSRARLESNPGNHRIGFWTDPQDGVSWEFKPTRWGKYDLELTFSADGGEGTELQLEVAGQNFTVKRPSTGGWYRYQTLPIGRVHFSKAEPFTLRVSCKTLKGGAVMNLKAVTMRPAPEGNPITQSVAGVITLLARDATTHGVMLRYEPAEIKNCLGYWVNPDDWAGWEFAVTKPGAFDVEVWQGCGKGQGGSEAEVRIAGEKLDFIVQETGHFQIFVPRRVGRVNLSQPGSYRLAVRALRKKAGAVMDVQQVRLIPVASAQNVSPNAARFLNAHRVVFLGDSITYSGEYTEFIEAYVRIRFPESRVAFLNLGLPSETVSGLSEPGHAGGAFPRPDLHERLGRVLEKTKPDVIVACYGMNDGIYYPFDTERFQKFKDGILRLRERAAAAGAKVIHVTPPTFDRLPLKGHTLPDGLAEYQSPYDHYNDVLDRFSDWLLSQRAQGWEVIDVHDPMNRFLAGRRRTDPDFILARDGVHANAQGHWLIAREILRYLGAPDEIVSSDAPDLLTRSHPNGTEILKLVQQKQRVLKDAWLKYVGHKRPGMNPGKPLPEAEGEAGALDAKIHALAEVKSAAGGPVDADNRPLIRKLGTIDLDLVETTPIVFKDRLYRFEWVREGYWNNQRKTNYFRLIDHETGVPTAPFADGHEFGSAFVDGDTVYVTGTRGRNRVDMFVSRDLKTWDSRPVINDGRYGIFNTSLCKAGDGYVLMFEIDKPAEEAGVPFTARFAKSRDLRAWEITPPECNYAKDRYTAPHCLRWLDGWFYDFFLEAHDGYEMRVVRSRDLIHWQASPLNPVLRASPEDKVIANPKLTDAQRARVAHAVNLNNSDIDFCEWRGHLVINYSWGNQQGVEHLAEAVYDGSREQFLRGWFPAGDFSAVPR
ncbi:MAG TPA: GDSL-type esterase/lipase family protein [Candidatus Angelobacter sp.]|nr:GDSL-type esterase/lipase family protein [Candidatus Angelobacter sp.]